MKHIKKMEKNSKKVKKGTIYTMDKHVEKSNKLLLKLIRLRKKIIYKVIGGKLMSKTNRGY